MVNTFYQAYITTRQKLEQGDQQNTYNTSINTPSLIIKYELSKKAGEKTLSKQSFIATDMYTKIEEIDGKLTAQPIKAGVWSNIKNKLGMK